MKCTKCREHIKNPDHNTVIMASKAYCAPCADEITVKAKTIEIIAKPTEDVPEYPAIAISKDMDEILKDNKIGKLSDEELHAVEEDFPNSD